MSSIRVKQSLKGKINNKILKEYPELEDLVVTPKKEDQEFKSEMYGYDNVKVKGDVNFIPENIIENVKIFGITGTYKEKYNTLIGPSGASSFNILQWVKELPEIDCTGVTSLQNSFNGASNLKFLNIKNTGSVTSWNSCFRACSSLTEISSTLDTSSATDFNQLFYQCSSLVEVPVMNAGKIVKNTGYNGFNYMFTSCPNLSDNSLNNIMATCISATQVTDNKTLSRLGLSSSQITKCKSLSNYQAFIDAGWSAT